MPLSLVGVGLAVFAGASVLSGLVAGPLTDRYGRKPVMLAALAGSSASFFAFSVVGGNVGWALGPMVAGLVSACFGVACGFSPVVAGTLLQAELPGVIWAIQLAAAGLVTLAALQRSSRGA